MDLVFLEKGGKKRYSRYKVINFILEMKGMLEWSCKDIGFCGWR